MQNCIHSFTSKLAALQRWFCNETFCPSHLSGSEDAEFAAEGWLIGPGGEWIRGLEKCPEERRAVGLLCTSIQARCSVAWRWRAKCVANMPNYSPPPKKEKREKKKIKTKQTNKTTTTTTTTKTKKTNKKTQQHRFSRCCLLGH